MVSAMHGAFSAFRSRLRLRVLRFAHARGGAAAVEFALISIPFFLLMFGIIELALIFLLSTTMDNATDTASRTIRTGSLQTSGTATAAAFKTEICNGLGWLQGDCQANLAVDVQTYPSFTAAGASQPFPLDAAGKFDASKTSFSMGGQRSIVVVRAFYHWPFITPMVSKAVKPTGDGSILLMSTVTFRNEPYGG
jgi:Flp pilus assembly protein TadG